MNCARFAVQRPALYTNGQRLFALFSHTKFKGRVRYLGVAVDYVLEMAEHTEIFANIGRVVSRLRSLRGIGNRYVASRAFLCCPWRYEALLIEVDVFNSRCHALMDCHSGSIDEFCYQACCTAHQRKEASISCFDSTLGMDL